HRRECARNFHRAATSVAQLPEQDRPRRFCRLDSGAWALLSEGLGPAVSCATAIKRPGRSTLKGRPAGWGLRPRTLYLQQYGLVSPVTCGRAGRVSDVGEHD